MASFDAAGLDTIILSSPEFPQLEADRDLQSLFYEYLKNGTVNGTPVVLGDRDLCFSNEQLMLEAMQQKSLIKVWSGYLSPLHPLDVKKYEQIWQMISDNKAVKIDEQKQYSAAKDAFLTVLTYALIHLLLNLRFNFYRLQE